ncbi:MAG TPA: protein-L-isoaspartate(D-aspartate) O-methyltransferase [Solirubrobacterales bacterium]|nr:protein-L-isoaspartate(D-aspartate) O-methyltransferase [Solirubrobacterales bacterium]
MNAAAERRRMVERQLRARGIEDEGVLEAMAEVPREEFVPEELRDRAYADSALPIGAEQTISQPWIVAAICQALELRGPELVLEVGTGSGYSAAVLARLVSHVVSIERHEDLSNGAARALAAQGIRNVELVVGDGSLGVPERGPYDAIAVHATAPAPPPSLQSQLAEGGRLVVPLEAGDADVLTLFRRRGEHFEAEPITPCRFVPLIGEEGFAE